MQGHEIESQSTGQGGLESPNPLTKKDRGTTRVAPFEVNMRDSDLNDRLNQLAIRIDLFVPDLFKGIMSLIPGSGIKQFQSLRETRIVGDTQRLAIFFAGSLRRRIDSGVTSSISPGPMYSRARSSVICTGA